MITPFPPDTDPQSNLIEFKRQPREGTLKPVRAPYGACKHERVTVSEATRTVTCSACDTELDAFAVLLEMAHKQRRWLNELDEWDARRDSLLSERYDREWERKAGDIVSPPTDLTTLRIWETFHAYLKDKFCGMYRRKARKRYGAMWYGRTSNGGCVSYEYARSRLIPEISPVQPKQGAGINPAS